MIIRFKYIFCLFAILSLAGPGDSISLYSRNVHDIRESGWVTTAFRNRHNLKCYRFRKSIGTTINLLIFKIKQVDLIRHYGKDVRIRLLEQTALFLNLSFTVLILNKLYHHTMSVMNHHHSSKWTTQSAINCLSCSFLKDVRRIMWNHLLTIKWTNQKLRTFSCSMESGALRSGLHGGHP